MEASLHVLVIALLVVTSSVRANKELQQETEAENRQRVQRDVEGLMPFPRVGRRDTTLIEPRDSSNDKRQGLIAFPRVGRSGNSDPRMAWMLTQEGADNTKPSGSALASSPWFGPRLGRSQRHGGVEAVADYPWALVNLRDTPGMHQRGQRGRDSSFTPRLGRELGLGLGLTDADYEELRPAIPVQNQ